MSVDRSNAAVIVKVFLADGSYKAFAADGALTFAALTRLAVERFLLQNASGWSFYEYRDMGLAEAVMSGLEDSATVFGVVKGWGSQAPQCKIVFKGPTQLLDPSSFKPTVDVSSPLGAQALPRADMEPFALHHQHSVSADHRAIAAAKKLTKASSEYVLKERIDRAETEAEDMRARFLVTLEKAKAERTELEESLRVWQEKAEAARQELEAEKAARLDAEGKLEKLLDVAKRLRKERDDLKVECQAAEQEARTGMLALQRAINERDKKVHQLEHDKEKLKKSVSKRDSQIKTLKQDHVREMNATANDFRALREVYKKKEDELQALSEKLRVMGGEGSPMGSPMIPRAISAISVVQSTTPTMPGASKIRLPTLAVSSGDEMPCLQAISPRVVRFVDWKGLPGNQLRMSVKRIGSRGSGKTINVYKDESLLSEEVFLQIAENSNVILSVGGSDGAMLGEIVMAFKQTDAPGYDRWVALPGKHNGAEVRLVACIRSERIDLAYDVKEEIGTGSIGVVSRAIERETGREVAVKRISRDAVDEEGIEPLHREIEIMRELKNPFIVDLFKVVSTTNNVYIIMELLSGGDLYGTIADGSPLPERRAAEYTRQILSAVEFMHSKGVVHRDLKLENLLLSKDDKVKVSDFGFSVRVSGIEMKSMAGTPSYMAPEIILAEPYGPNCDIWSVGVVLFILYEITRKSIAGQYSFPSPEWDAVSDEAKAFIRKMLTHDSKKRPSATECLKDPWLSQK
eukprot:m51a1_g2088 putative ca2+ calmodulin-dependent protein kinase ii (744) ;mRNA; r:1518420-1521701